MSHVDCMVGRIFSLLIGSLELLGGSPWQAEADSSGGGTLHRFFGVAARSAAQPPP